MAILVARRFLARTWRPTTTDFFPTATQPMNVAALRAAKALAVSLVAEVDSRVPQGKVTFHEAFAATA